MEKVITVIAIILTSCVISLAQAKKIDRVFTKSFECEIPDLWLVTFAGEKKGEKQFSIYDHEGVIMSFFVYTDGLDPRKWGAKRNKEEREFLYFENGVFVTAKIPKNLDKPTVNSLWELLESIRLKNSNQTD